MLRRQGLTPAQLRARYEEDIQRPFGEVDLLQLYGKPPYEFLGQTRERDYPNYKDFQPQYVDDLGREYQRTDEPNRYFVRIPIALTRSRGKNGYTEDYIGFPRNGDQLNLTSFDEEVHARVTDCPFDRNRAVSNVFVENVLRVEFIPDFVDSHGRTYMRCVRNACFLAGRAQESADDDDEDVALYYVRLPSLFFQRRYERKVRSLMSARKRQRRNRPTASAESAAFDKMRVLVAQEFVDATRPYAQQASIERGLQMNGDGTFEEERDNVPPELTDDLRNKAIGRVCSTIESDSIHERRFPELEDTVCAYQLYGDRLFDFVVQCDTQVRARHSSQSSAILALRFVAGSIKAVPDEPQMVNE